MIAPHVPGETQLAPSVGQVAAKLAAWERGEAVGGVVDPARGY